MTAMTDDTRQHGFTLLEILIALAVLGFLFVGLAQGIHFGLFAWATEARLTNGNDDFNTLDNALRRLIEAVEPGDDYDPVTFAAKRDGFDCITTLPNASGAMPGRRIQATLLVDADHRLVLRWQPSVRARRLRAPPALTETELLRGVSSVELSFWRPGGGWVSAWRSRDLPTLVRVRLHFPPGDVRHWPEIVAAPVLDRP
jgi:general secretion pathway protein J